MVILSVILSETPNRDPYMGIDTSSDEFYNINTNQSGPPRSVAINFNPDYSDQIQMLNLLHFQRNQADKNGLVLYTCQDIYTNS